MRAKVSSHALLLPALALFSLPGFGQPGPGNGQNPGGPTPTFGQGFDGQEFNRQGFNGGQGFTQELTLFQDDGSSRGSPQGGGGSQSGEPGTTGVILKAIYRFGNTYHVSLQSGDGGAVQQFEWQQGQGQAPSFNGYQIQVVDTRNVTFALPPGMSCQPNPQFGGNCVGRNQMSVTFAQTEPRRNNNQRTNNNNNNNNNNNRTNNDQQWFSTQNGTDVRALIDAARANPNGAERQQLEALIRAERGGGRGNFNNNDNNNNTNGRGGRGGGGGGGFNGGNNTGGNNTGGNNTGGRGGGGGGRGGGGFGN